MPTARRAAAQAYRQEARERLGAQVAQAAGAHGRYHSAQADRRLSTAAKRLAARAGGRVVRCPCGTEFPAPLEGR